MILGWETGTGKQEQGTSREANHDILSQANHFLAALVECRLFYCSTIDGFVNDVLNWNDNWFWFVKSLQL